MPSPPTYRLGRTAQALTQVKALAAKADAVDLHDELLAALREVVYRLQSKPTDFGDPRFNTKLPGGLVYHALLRPLLSIQYAVYEQEKAVILLRVVPLPGSGLE